jgi:hypothetical protein
MDIAGPDRPTALFEGLLAGNVRQACAILWAGMVVTRQHARVTMSAGTADWSLLPITPFPPAGGRYCWPYDVCAEDSSRSSERGALDSRGTTNHMKRSSRAQAATAKATIR